MSNSQYLLQNANSRSTNVTRCRHTKNDSIFTNNVLSISNLQNQLQSSHWQRWTQFTTSLVVLPVFFNQPMFYLTQDQKGLFKACSGAECNGLVS